jgi:proteasome lid subunit RPN8/RPN11
MSGVDMQFGDVQQAEPRSRRRPDRDRHFAVAACGEPAKDDLPVFVDVDAMIDMETHAASDTSVELGGVMLGYQAHDADGKPFVVVTDNLRAAHYENGKGHFKFTHDTWAQIGRERDEFSDDLEMVGWYHTHPDWGVFLSGMDRFICDHFFNRPLDVALVIDPVRDDRGWFYWNHAARKDTLPRSGGFYLTASRFRRREVEAAAARLEGNSTMTGETHQPATSLPAHVFHTVRPQFGWIGASVAVMLALQLVLTLFVVLRHDVAGAADAATDQAAASGADATIENRIAENDKSLQRILEHIQVMNQEAALRQRTAALDAREGALVELLGKVRVDAGGNVDVSALVESHRKQRARLDELEGAQFALVELSGKFKELETLRDTLTVEVAQLQSAMKQQQDEADGARRELAAAEKQRDAAVAAEKKAVDRLAAADSEGRNVSAREDDSGENGNDAETGFSLWWTAAVVVLVLLVIGTGVGLCIAKPRAGATPVGPKSKSGSGDAPAS